jgi:DnaJ-class molecular chaperone
MKIQEHNERLKTDSSIIWRRANPVYRFNCVKCGGSGFIDHGNSESGDIGYGQECTNCRGSGRVDKEWDGRLYIG